MVRHAKSVLFIFTSTEFEDRLEGELLRFSCPVKLLDKLSRDLLSSFGGDLFSHLSIVWRYEKCSSGVKKLFMMPDYGFGL